MPIKVTCSKCQGVLHAPDDAGGKRGKCPTCGNVLSIPGGSSNSLIPPEPGGLPLAPTPFNAAPAPRQTGSVFGSPPDDGRRSSFSSGLTGPTSPPAPLPASHDPRKASVARPAGLSAGASEPQPSADPFSKSGPRASAAEAGAAARSWRRTRRGLWFVQAGYFFALLAVVIPAGLRIATTSGLKLPDKPGVLKLTELRMPAEISIASLLIPAALACLCLALGRVGASGAPRVSFARGMFRWAALATMLALMGVIAFAAVAVAQVAVGSYPMMLMPDDLEGLIQRVGLAAAAVFAPLAELWFVVALGRMGSGLHDERLSGRGTRALVYAGLVFAVAMLAGFAWSTYPTEIERVIAEHVQPRYDALGSKQAFVAPGVAIAAALAVWLVYVRLVGAARAAVHGWLDVNRG